MNLYGISGAVVSMAMLCMVFTADAGQQDVSGSKQGRNGLQFAYNLTKPHADSVDSVSEEVGVEQALTLVSLLEAAAVSHPSMLASRLSAKAAAQDIVVAERQRWPTVSVSAETDTGNAYSQPSRLLRVDQVLWDFGRNGARIEEARMLSSVASVEVDLQAQSLFLSIADAWQSLLSANERSKTAVKTIGLLQNFRMQMQRRVDAQVSPVIDLELVDSRLLQTNVELELAKTNLRTAVLHLAQLTGMPDIEARLPLMEPLPDMESIVTVVGEIDGMDLNALVDRHPAVIKAKRDVETVSARLSAKHAEKWPEVYVRVDQSLGSTEYSQSGGAHIFFGVRYAPGAGFSQFVEADSLETRLAGMEQTVLVASREVNESFQSDREELVNASLRIGSLTGAVKSSDKVLNSYLRQFQAGRKSWLDLLNTVREQAQNEYNLADAQASLVGAMSRFAIRAGQFSF